MAIQYDKSKYPVELIADVFIYKSKAENKIITNKKLQKVIYYGQAWNIVYDDIPLFGDAIEAWVHGPTVRKIYNKYRHFGFNPIVVTIDENPLQTINKWAQSLLNNVWNVYGKYDADYLEMLTHSESPWQKAREGLEISDLCDTIISLDEMRNYYKGLLK